MRFIFRKALVGLVASLAMGAVSVSAASAAPEFLHKGKEVVKKKFTGGGGESHLRVGNITITCSKTTISGAIEGKAKVTEVQYSLTKCGGENEKKERCEAQSPGAEKEMIVTKKLKGELGKIKANEAKSEVGLDLKPKEGQTVLDLGGGTKPCWEGTNHVTGGVVGEVKPVGVEQLTSEVVYEEYEGHEQMITKFNGTQEILKMFGMAARLTSIGKITFEEAVEVTKE